MYLVGNDRGVQAMLTRMDTLLSPPAIAGFLGAKVDPYLRGRARSRFRAEGDDVTGAWVPLASATREIRAQMGYGAEHPINRRTGQLEEYIAGSPNQINIHALGATLTLPGQPPVGEIKSKVETAQKGKSYPRTPARPVLGMNEKDLAYVLTALAFHVKGGGFR